jgi:hypothetical protein
MDLKEEKTEKNKLVNKLPKILLVIFGFMIKAFGLVMVALIAVIFIGEGPPNIFELSAREQILFVCLFITLAGTIATLKLSFIGGIMMVAGMLPFISFDKPFSEHWVFYAFLITGLLNIVYSQLKKFAMKNQSDNFIPK